jgi:hypothetical protein
MPQQPGDDRPDLAGSDHCSGLARHVEADETIEGKVGVTHAIVRSVDVAVQAEHQREGVLGHGVW